MDYQTKLHNTSP